jgi:hypothetical protein
MNVKITVYFLLLLLWGLSSCDNQPQPDNDLVVPPPIKGAVWVANEGNFQSGNSTLTILDVGENKLYQNVFETANGRKLGDVFQSVNIFNNRAYLVVNNSQKIEVIHPTTFKSIATISGFTSPRYILQVNATRAYVSEYYANAVRIVDLGNNTIIGSIPMSGLLEEMVLVKNKVYVSNTRGHYVYIIDPSSNQVTDSVHTVYSSNSLQVDSAQNIWVLSNGDPSTNVLPSLQRINTTVDTVDRSFSLGMSEVSVTRLRINTTRNKLYWLSRHVYSIGINDLSVSNSPLIHAVDQNFYGLGVNPYDNQIYASDAKDFVQQSTIYRFSPSGVYRGEFKAGLIGGDFYFYYP